VGGGSHVGCFGLLTVNKKLSELYFYSSLEYKHFLMHSCDFTFLITIATKLWAGRSGFDSWQELGIFLFAIAFRMALGSTRPPVQWVPGALSPGVKRLVRKADNSTPSGAGVKNAWNYTAIPHTSLRCGA
jgi:hypothetical protein